MQNPWKFGIARDRSSQVELFGEALLRLLDTTFATKTAVNAESGYPTVGYVGDRAALLLQTAAGSAAVTDGMQFQVVAGCMRPQGTGALVGKSKQQSLMRMYGSFYAGDLVNADVLFGFAALDTSLIASEATDFIGIRKLKADTGFSVRARKASGTVETTQISGALGDDTWIEFDMALYRTGTGVGSLEVRMGINPKPGDPLTDVVANIPILAQLPDTVSLTPSAAWRVGVTAAQEQFAIGSLGWEQFRN